MAKDRALAQLQLLRNRCATLHFDCFLVGKCFPLRILTIHFQLADTHQNICNREVLPRGLPSLTAVNFEDLYPAWRRFISGVGGTLWVQRHRPVSALTDEELEGALAFNRPPASPEWDVFDPEGRYLGVIELPCSDRALNFWNDRVYGVWEDELDVQYVVAWQIEGLPHDMY